MLQNNCNALELYSDLLNSQKALLFCLSSIYSLAKIKFQRKAGWPLQTAAEKLEKD